MRFKSFLRTAVFLIVYCLLFTNVKYISESVLKSLAFCSKTLIPSIFPFMVISIYAVNCSVNFIDKRKVNLSLSDLLGVCKIYKSAVILGSVSGFVTGAKCICGIYDNRKTDCSSFNHAIAVSSNAGLGFVISCVGILIWDSVFIGFVIYITQICLALILGRLFYGRCNNTEIYVSEKKRSNIKAFTDAVVSSTSSVLNICSFVIVFSLIGDVLSLFIPDKALDMIKILLEFSRGVFNCSAYSSNIFNGFLCGFCIGFGGLSAFFQISSLKTIAGDEFYRYRQVHLYDILNIRLLVYR